jgi:hypothetical protein
MLGAFGALFDPRLKDIQDYGAELGAASFPLRAVWRAIIAESRRNRAFDCHFAAGFASRLLPKSFQAERLCAKLRHYFRLLVGSC